ncbi:endonuclease V-like [Protopterus annectens]|uniref:endonuclease V-like n=1 Tax=Protopterus annectens TaxID=7888 RepID=UPI001CF9FC01|nr:endonuclease V-like [Protopterus annectens]
MSVSCKVVDRNIGKVYHVFTDFLSKPKEGEFGLACHLGVLTDIPCIGVAKNLLQVDGLESRAVHKEQIRDLHNGGDQFRLLGSSGKVLGMALKSCEKSSKPIYVSVGHRISLESAVRLIHSCCKYRVPEPIRQADIRSREYIRRNVLQTDGKAKQSPNSLMRKKLHKASSASSCTKPSPSAFQNHPCEDYEDSIAALFEECCI